MAEQAEEQKRVGDRYDCSRLSKLSNVCSVVLQFYSLVLLYFPAVVAFEHVAVLTANVDR